MKMQAFCGGPVNGIAMPIEDAIHSYWVPLDEYKWSQETVTLADGEAWVFHWNYDHEPFENWEAVMGAGPSLVELMWVELDAGYKKLNETGSQMEPVVFGQMQGYLRGIAWCIAHFMNPLFTTADQVVRECMIRYEHFKSGEPYETKGLGSRRYETATASKYATLNQTATQAEKPKHNLSPEQVEKIKAARASGMFSDDDICEMYKLKIETLRSL